jgi:hypothetical protein
MKKRDEEVNKERGAVINGRKSRRKRTKNIRIKK